MAQGPGEVDGVSVATNDTVAAADDIRSQIAQTRAEMSETIDAIQTRLSPSRVIGDAKDSITEATVGPVKRLADRVGGPGGGMLRRLQEQPLPAALTAAAVAGLLARALRNRRTAYVPPSTPRARDHHWRRRNALPRSGAKTAGLIAAAGVGAACCVLASGAAVRT